MKNEIIICFLTVFAVIGFTRTSKATTLIDNFDSGINYNLWNKFQMNAAGSPWMIDTLNTDGTLKIAKGSDTDIQTKYMNLGAGIKSNFYLDGNFSISVDFSIVNLPFANTNGWNEIILQIENGSQEFECLRHSSNSAQYAEKRWGSYITYPCSYTTGTLGITRHDSTVSAWISNGTNTIQLGSSTSNEFLGKTFVNLYLCEESDHADTGRPSTAMDVRFDNFTATADVITPEPTTLLLLGFGAVMLRSKS